MDLINIPDDQIIIGMEKSLENAGALLTEAYLLSTNKKYARAYCLCQFAIEELGKIQLLFDLLIKRINGEEIDYKQLNYDFKNHSAKTIISIESQIAYFKLMKVQTGYSFADKLIDKSEKLLSRKKELNDLKNESLYVSAKETGFQSPQEIIDEEKYNDISGIAYLWKEISKNIIRVVKEDIKKIAKLIKEEQIDFGAD